MRANAASPQRGQRNAAASEDDGGASRRLSHTSSDAAANAARYSWHGDITKTRVLLRLVNDTVKHKREDQRRVTTHEWEIILDAFNREVSPPAESARVLHNRFSNLRVQCKEYHQVVTAQRKGLLASVDSWVLFLKVNPTLRKWRKKPFEFYDDMVECLRLQGEDLDNLPTDDEWADANDNADSSNNNSTTTSRFPTTTTAPKRRRTTSAPTASSLPVARANAPNGVVSISHYPAALRHLATLALPIEDRVDAKRFLVLEANAQAFIYMDEDERRYFLQKYCFDRRESLRREAAGEDDQDPPAAASPSSS